MNKFSRTLVLPIFLIAAQPLIAGTESPLATSAEGGSKSSDEIFDDLNDWSLFDGKLTASLHGAGVYGGTTGEVEELQTGGHDPKREGWTIQGLEPGISLRPTEHIEGFANGIFFTDSSGDWDFELEEAFGTIKDLPGGFSLRGGQFLNRVGFHNATHLHSWNEIDYPVALARFFGDDGLNTRSGEVNWEVPIGDPLTNRTQLSVAYGEVRPHDHDHGGEDHEEHGDNEFEGEGADFNDKVLTANLLNRHTLDDFNQISTAATFIYGDNEFGRENVIGGLSGEYLWRENGLEPGGRAFRVRGEFYVRNVAGVSGELHEEGHHDDHHEDEHGEEDHHDEEGEDHEDEHHDDHHEGESIRRDFNEFGAYVSATYTWNEHWDTGLRAGYVGGISDLGLDERFRVSPNLTYYLDDARRFHLRGQYNYDHGSSFGDEHSVWIQAGFSFGAGNEVR